MGSWHGGSGAHWNAPSLRNLWHGWARYTHEPSVNCECCAMVLNLSFLWFTGFSDWEDDSVQQELPGDCHQNYSFQAFSSRSGRGVSDRNAVKLGVLF